ncbi:hypothetical protein FB45DRAFT_1084873 [Roridomyces roridus]|uniref:F-box domain-containing protein n=1 Tax=Roridomyces roridus TaxID=1738132 RepID=A0AAD7FL34_9AGAR|nr:hypothetical protein FB45DRAFT_1084873 [Roridomyces roridus]
MRLCLGISRRTSLAADPSSVALSWARENLVPDDEQRASIQETIAELQGPLDSHVDDSEVDHLRHHIDLWSSLLAPIRRIPREVLSEIFLQPSLHESPRARSPKFSHRGTNAILAVSHHWRETILSTAEFWAQFDVALPGNSNGASLLELYLKRSKQAPLSIAVLAWGAGPIWHARILQLLISSCERWAHLYLETGSAGLPALSPLRGHLPLLSSLDLHLHSGWMPLDTPQSSATAQPDAFEVAPCLTTLTLNVRNFPITPLLPLLPQPQIKNLVIGNLDSLLFAKDFPDLRILSFSRTSMKFGMDGLSSAVEISAPVLHAFPLMLKFITAPAVRLLDLDTKLGIDNHTTLSMDIWTPFIRRSACRPHTLQLHNLVIPSRDLLPMLTDLPNLHTLVLRDLGRPDAITTNLLTQLTLSPSGAGTMIFPELTNLTIVGSYIFTNVSLLAMLESRSDSIERVKLEFKQRTFTAEELHRARALKGKGVDLTLWCVDAEKKYVQMI